MSEESFECSKCGEAFDSKEELKSHREEIHSTSLDDLTEKLNDKISGFRSNLNRSFALGLMAGILITSGVFSGFLYLNSLDYATTVPVTVVTCDSCEYDRFREATDRMFKTEYREVNYQSEEGQELIREHGLIYVPGFIFEGTQLEKAENFTSVESTLVKSGEDYVIPDAGIEVAQRLSSGINITNSPG